MGLGWRRAFCTSIPKDKETDSPIIMEQPDPTPSPKLGTRFVGFFSNPSTPRLHRESIPSIRCRTVATAEAPPNVAGLTKSAPQSPRLQCKINNSPRLFNRPTPSSPRSPSAFHLLKSSLRLSKSRCGICVQSVKTGQGTAIFTAECGHSFHFPCIAAYVKEQCSLNCPVCSSTWKEMHLLNSDNQATKSHARDYSQNPKLKVYNDDEPLSSPTNGAGFNTIPETDESMDEDYQEFPGFVVDNNNAVGEKTIKTGSLEVSLLSESAVVSIGKTTATYVVVLRIRAPPAPLRRAPIDLVTVLNVSRSISTEKMHLMKKTMRMVVYSLSAIDRLSIVAFSSTSKRLLPLRRMNPSGRRAARRIIDAIVVLDGVAVTSATDSLRKAAKVIEDRREVNPAASILLFSDGHRSGPLLFSTRFSTAEIPVHSVSLSSSVNAPGNDTLTKYVSSLLRVVVQDVRVQLTLSSGSAPAMISGVYSYAGRAAFLGSKSDWCRVGDFYSEDERELLVELKLPSSFLGSHRLLSVRCSYKDPSTEQQVYDNERPLLVPHPRAIESSTRVRCLFVTTRAVAESRRLMERNDVAGAHHMLASARALVLHSGAGLSEEFVRGLEAEMAEIHCRRSDPLHQRSRNNHEKQAATIREEEKDEPLTPTSAWRAAERLAKLAIMRKSLNRVSDLHGFENARF